MAHEFNIKNGFITSGQSYVYNNLVVTGLTISSVPTNDDTLTQILARDSSGVLKYRTASSLGGGGGTFTGGTVTGPTIFTSGLSANTISATTYQNLPLDITVTGGTYLNGTATFTNNTGGTFSVTGFSTGSSVTQGLTGVTNGGGISTLISNYNLTITNTQTQGITGVTGTNGLSATTSNNVTTIGFSGGTIPNSVNFTNGLTANTISATTYYNLPLDIRVTGGTYSNGTATFTNNTGGTFSVTGFSTTTQGLTGLTASNGVSASTTNNVTTIGFSGGTINSPVNFTNGLSANTISATTYQGNVVTSIVAGNNINVNTGIGDVTVTAVPSSSDTAIQFNNSSSFGGDNTTLAYILSQVTFIGGSTSYTVAPSVTNSSIIGGDSNSLSDNTSRSVIVGGRSSEIRGNSVNSSIIGGDTNIIASRNNTVILGGSNIVAAASDFVYVPSLNINTTPANDDTLTQVLVRDSGTGDIKYRNSSTFGGGGGSGTFTGGTVSGGTTFISGVTANTLIYSVVTLSSGSTIAVNAVLGNEFKVTLGGNSTLGNPTGAVDGQYLRFAIRQDNTGGRNLTFDTKYRFGNEIGTPSVDLTANKTSYLGVRYNSADDKFDVISFVSGY